MRNQPEHKTLSIKNIFERALKEYGLDEKFYQAQIQVYWDDIIGSNTSQRAKINRLKNGALFIETSSSVWKSEFQTRSTTIKENINQMLGKQVVKEIIVK